MQSAEHTAFWDIKDLRSLRYHAAALKERAGICAGCTYAFALCPGDKSLLREKAGSDSVLEAAMSALGLDSLCSCRCEGDSEVCGLTGQWLEALEDWCLGSVHHAAPVYQTIEVSRRHARYQHLYALEAYVQHECGDPCGVIDPNAWMNWRQDFIEKAGFITQAAFLAQIDFCWPGQPLVDQLKKFADEIQVPQQREAFWRAFLIKYPVMTRRLTALITISIKMRRDFTKLLFDSHQKIRSTFFPNRPSARIVGISPGLSDVHEDGWAVCKITYEDGGELIYKPHISEVEGVWTVFLNEVSELAGLSPFKIPCVLKLDSGIIQEWIEQKPVSSEEAIAGYFFRAGFLSCIVFSLGGSDFHCENVIAFGDCPVLVDVETVVGRHIGAESTILSNNFYPFLGFGKGLVPGDCALCDMAGTQNLPTIDGEVFFEAYAYGEYVLDGFKLAYQTLMTNERHLRELVKGFEGLSARLVLRPTMYYHKLMTLMNRPERMRGAIDAEAGIFWLARSYQGDMDHLATYFVQEFHSLQALLFPKILAVIGQKGYAQSPIPGGLRMLSEMDCRRNARRIRVSLQSTRLDDGAAEVWHDHEGDNTQSIAEKSKLTVICERYARCVLGVLEHKTDQFVGVQGRNRYYFGPDKYCMMEGLLGMAVGLSASVHVIGRHSLVQETLDNYLRALQIQIEPHSVLGFGPGLADGLGGLIRGLTIIGVHMPDSRALSILDDLLSRLMAEIGRIRCSDNAALLYGDAGLLLALCHLTIERRNAAENMIARISEWLVPALAEELQSVAFGRGLLDGVDGKLLAAAGVSSLLAGIPLESLYGGSAIKGDSLITGRAGITLASIRLWEAGYLHFKPALSPINLYINDTFAYGNAGRLYIAAVQNDSVGASVLASKLLNTLERGPRPMYNAEDTIYPGFFFGEGGMLYALMNAMSAGRVEYVF